MKRLVMLYILVLCILTSCNFDTDSKHLSQTTIDFTSYKSNNEIEKGVDVRFDAIEEGITVDAFDEDFQLYIGNIKSIEKKVQESNPTLSVRHVNNKVLDFVRLQQYNTDEWKLLAGDIKAENKALYNELKDTEEVLYLSNKTSVRLSEDYQVDILHMLAAVDMGLNNHMFLGSLGGDIVEAAKTGDVIGDEGGRFNLRDLEADIDANNIYYIIKDRNCYISEALVLYYKRFISSESTYRYTYYTSFVNSFDEMWVLYSREPMMRLLERKFNVSSESVDKKIDELIRELRRRASDA